MPARAVIDVSSTVRRPPIPTARVKELVTATLRAEKVKDALVSVAFVGRESMTRLNREHLGHDGPTDVISFGMGRDGRQLPAIGDIYICPDVAIRNARRLGIESRAEMERLVVHGTLHVVGHQHPEDESRESSRMWKRQERILASCS